MLAKNRLLSGMGESANGGNGNTEDDYLVKENMAEVIERKALFWTTYSAFAPVHDAERELILREKATGARIVGVYCNGSLKRCHAQRGPQKDHVECAKCNAVFNARIAPLLDEIILLAPSEEKFNPDISPTNAHALRECRLEGSDIGTGVLSTLKTDFGDDDLPVADLQSQIMDRIESAVLVHRALSKLVDAHKPNIVYFFNGRQFDSRPLLRICQNRNIAFSTYEVSSNLDYFKLRNNTTVHDVAFTQALFNAFTKSPRISRSNFNVRHIIDSQQDIYQRGFRLKQQSEALPAGFEQLKKNIVILHSSEDEYADVDCSLRFWIGTNFLDFLEKLLAIPSMDELCRVYVRLHPRLAHYNSRSVRKLTSLSHPLLHVIPPASPVDTFELAKRSAITICYGSTAGPEAVILGARVVCVSDCWYSASGLMPVARDLQSLENLINNPLQVKCDADAAERYLEFLRYGDEPFRLLQGKIRGSFEEIRSIRIIDKLAAFLLSIRVPIAKSGLGLLIYTVSRLMIGGRQ